MTALRLCVLSAALLAALPPAAAPGASWTAPRTIAVDADVQFRLAMGADGTAAATWASRGAVRASVKRPGGAWSRPARVSDGRFGVARPAVAVTSRGEVVVAWAQNGTRNAVGGPVRGPLTIRARVRGAAGRWSTIRRIGTTGHFVAAELDLAANRAGQTIAVWRGVRSLGGGRTSEAVQSAFRAPHTAFGGAQTVRDPEPGRIAVSGASVALDGAGAAYVAYTGPGPVVRLAARSRGATGSWRASRPVAGAPSSAAVLAVAEDRSVTIAWRAAHPDSEGDGVQSGGLDVRSRTVDGELTATEPLSTEPTRAYGVAVAPGLEALVTWTPASSVPSELHFSTRPPNGGFDTPHAAAGVVPSSDFHVEPVATGDGTFLQPVTTGDRARVYARPPGGLFAAPPELDAAGLYPLVAAADARAVAVWAVPRGEAVDLAASSRLR